MPNQPKTPVRSIRVPEWRWAKMLWATKRRGENITAATNRFYDAYIAETEGLPDDWPEDYPR